MKKLLFYTLFYLFYPLIWFYFYRIGKFIKDFYSTICAPVVGAAGSNIEISSDNIEKVLKELRVFLATEK